ncbi:MAG: restriction endonuclease subunit S [Limnobacter sp.]|uniref:restriction endonuclease subunit S n=1 Tax=Limnobacter sp. TaxID=2003368 RepID=UPI00300225BC
MNTPAEFSRFPSHWDLLPFTNAIKDMTSGNVKIQKSEYFESGAIPIVDQGQSVFGGYTNDVNAICKADLPTIIFGDHTRVFKYLETQFALGADGAKVLEPIAKLDKRFLYHYLKQLRIESAGYSRHYKFLKESYVPVPPLTEQKRIAAILDKADAIRRKRKKAIQLADEFLRAVFLDIFGDPISNPMGWQVKPLNQLATVTTGNTPPRKEDKYYGDHIEWVKSDNINTPFHFLTKASEYLSIEGKQVARVVAQGSTLVTCIAGSFDCIGNAAYTNREVAFNQQINALTPLAGVSSWFLYALVLFSKKHIQSASTNSMKGMVSKGKMEGIPMICPPLSLQQRFQDAFVRYLSLSEKLNRSSDVSNDVFNSLSQRAFSGQL